MSSVEQVELVIGKQFQSLEALKNFLRVYQNQERQQFTIYHSKLISRCNVKRKMNVELKYYEIRYVCKFGHQRQTESKGFRNSRTFKHGCAAFILVGVSKDGEYLEIKNFSTIHEGHDGSEAFFKHLPENRSLNKEQQMSAIGLLKLRCNKKLLQDQLSSDFDKIIIRKDLCNLASSMKNFDDDELPKAVSLLKNVHGAYVSILHENHQFKGLYFSTVEMRNSINFWPEIVFIDGTYKLFKRNFTLMILLVEDSNGGSRVVGVGVLSTEERETLKWFIECFKKENEGACSRMRCMMGDKDLTERDVIKELFPTIPMYICMFHTLRTFSREVSTNKMRISMEEKDQSLALLDRLTKSSSVQAYDETYKEFCNTAPSAVLKYFNKNWHNIRQEWTKYSIVEGNLRNCTNNRLESINNKIKQIVKKNSTMTDFVNDFFRWLNHRDREMSYNRIQTRLRKDVKVYEDGTVQQAYKERLTKYAFSLVLKEIDSHDAITIRKINSMTQECLIKYHNVMIKASTMSCECSTWCYVRNF